MANDPINPNSRYADVERTSIVTADGRTVPYLRRRFLPAVSTMVAVRTIRVEEGDRLDLLSARLFGDAEQYWRLCDANPTIYPGDIERTGETLQVALPGDMLGQR